MQEPPLLPDRFPASGQDSREQSIPVTDRHERSVPRSSPRRIDNRGVIFLMLFRVTVFLGIPVLYQSRAFSATKKWVESMVVTIYTSGLSAITAGIVY